MLNSRLLDPMIQNRKVELSLEGLNLLPGNRHQHGVDVGVRNARQDFIGLRCPCRRVDQFTAEDNERSATNNNCAEP